MTDLIKLAECYKSWQNFRWMVGMVAALVGVSMTACVEQQPSIVMTGSLIGKSFES